MHRTLTGLTEDRLSIGFKLCLCEKHTPTRLTHGSAQPRMLDAEPRDKHALRNLGADCYIQHQGNKYKAGLALRQKLHQGESRQAGTGTLEMAKRPHLNARLGQMQGIDSRS